MIQVTPGLCGVASQHVSSGSHQDSTQTRPEQSNTRSVLGSTTPVQAHSRQVWGNSRAVPSPAAPGQSRSVPRQGWLVPTHTRAVHSQARSELSSARSVWSQPPQDSLIHQDIVPQYQVKPGQYSGMGSAIHPPTPPPPITKHTMVGRWVELHWPALLVSRQQQCEGRVGLRMTKEAVWLFSVSEQLWQTMSRFHFYHFLLLPPPPLLPFYMYMCVVAVVLSLFFLKYESHQAAEELNTRLKNTGTVLNQTRAAKESHQDGTETHHHVSTDQVTPHQYRGWHQASTVTQGQYWLTQNSTELQQDSALSHIRPILGHGSHQDNSRTRALRRVTSGQYSVTPSARTPLLVTSVMSVWILDWIMSGQYLVMLGHYTGSHQDSTSSGQGTTLGHIRTVLGHARALHWVTSRQYSVTPGDYTGSHQDSTQSCQDTTLGHIRTGHYTGSH